MASKNNLYTNLTNFYNLNDENFKEFLADLYQEMLNSHRDVEYVKEHFKEEIEKKLEEYLVNGKFEINIKNIVDEFLATALENNGTIKNMSDRITENNKSINKIKDNHLKLNIKDFGATGEESQDVTIILQDMLNNINENSATIIFPQGVYNITSEITLPNKTLNFVGDGVESTIIKNSSNNIIRSFFYKDSTNTKRFNSFKNIQFNGNKKVNRSIYYEKGNGTKIKNCRFINHLEAGIYFKANASDTGAVIYESEITGNYFRGVEGGVSDNNASELAPNYNIYLGSGATDSLIKDNISINAKTHLYINGGNNMVRDNHFFDYPVPQYNSECHIHLNGTSSIINNYFDSPLCGIKVTGERFIISNNNFFWGGEIIDRSNFSGISLDLTSSKKRGVVITNNYFNPIGSAVGYDIKVVSDLELPMIINNRSMNITNIYQSLIMYNEGTTRKVTINGNIVSTGNITSDGAFIGKFSPNVGMIPTKTGVILGNTTTPFQQITCEYSPKCNASNYTLTSFPSNITSGQQEIMSFIKNLGDRVKALESK